MAIPFLYTLPSTARAAYTFILSGTRRGLSGRAIERQIRTAGLQISRTRTIVPLMRELKKVEAAGRAVRFIAKGNAINLSRLPEALTKMGSEFSFLVKVEGISREGRAIDRFVTISTDRRVITPEEIEAEAEFMVSDPGGSQTLSNTRVTIYEGLRRATGV